MANNTSGESPLLKNATQVITILGATLATIYFAGGLVLGLRLFFAYLPFTIVIGQLPREFLLSQGLTSVALPFLGIAGLYLIYRLMNGPNLPPPRKRGLPTVLIATLISLVPGAFITVRRLGTDWRLLYLFVAFTITALVLSALFTLRTRVGSHFNTPQAYAKWEAIGLSMLIVASMTVPAWISFGAALPLVEAKVCSTGGAYSNIGVLIGETETRVYLGEQEEEISHAPRILSIPLTRVEEVFAGPDAEGAICDKGESQP
jgi:hypothetical protein